MSYLHMSYILNLVILSGGVLWCDLQTMFMFYIKKWSILNTCILVNMKLRSMGCPSNFFYNYHTLTTLSIVASEIGTYRKSKYLSMYTFCKILHRNEINMPNHPLTSFLALLFTVWFVHSTALAQNITSGVLTCTKYGKLKLPSLFIN